MSSVWRIDFDPTHLHFVTTSAIQHAHLFRREVMKQAIACSCNHMQAQGWLVIYGYVIMPSHIHLIVQCGPDHPLMDVMRDFKKFTAKQITAQLMTEGNDRALDYLRSAVKRPGKQAYAVWEDEYQAKDVVSPEFLWQKMEYIHNNPVQPHWRLVDKPEDYDWSSARFYLAGQQSAVTVSNAGELV
jgi:putative transposase